MKLLYEIPDRRPTKNDERDLRLRSLRAENPTLTFGQFAIKYNAQFAGSKSEEVSAKIAERALTRLESREKAKAQLVLAAAEEYRKTHGLSDAEVVQQLPTPVDVFNLLTTD
jgi:hypothetical protein